MKIYFASLAVSCLLSVVILVLVCYQTKEVHDLKRDLAKMASERDQWKAKADSAYPLVTQWRMGYEALVAKGCR